MGVRRMATYADIVVAGGGHNSLITACYLARAGYRCVVLDAGPVPGGGAATEELMLPGFGIDTCATGHPLIQLNPLLLRDELGLVSEYGLRYVEPDPVAHVVFPDGESLTMWLDRQRTAEQIARFSNADAAAYLRFLDDYERVAPEFARVRHTPGDTQPRLDRIWERRAALSAWDVIRHEFGSRHVQAFMLWLAFQDFEPPDTPGTGVSGYDVVYRRQRHSWPIPVGGSGRLIDALTAFLEAHGGRVECDQEVADLILDNGRCAGVETSCGDRYLATVAVVSSIHVKRLIDMVPRDTWPADFRYGIATYDPGIAGLGVYLCTTEPPRFGDQAAVSAGLAGWPEDVLRLCADLRAGVYSPDVPWLLAATPTLADPDRAPEGMHTVKLLCPQAYDVPDKRAAGQRMLAAVRRQAPNLDGDVILDSLVYEPRDYERLNPHMVRGAFHGGDRGPAFSGAMRPAPGWAEHRMPVAGLYQTGGCTHPGGSISGAPGRNAAIVLLADLGHDPEKILAPRAR
jgi:phytoene dehydrogenase-like protein